MSVTYRALARVFGTFDAVLAVRKLFLEAEIATPAYNFSIDVLGLSHDEAGGYILRGEMNRRRPAFADLDFTAEPFSQHPQLIIELLVEDGEAQTHKVFQAGKLLYEASREEATGDVFVLGAPGVEYCYGKETGVRDAFLIALQAAGIVHRLHPL